MHFCIMFTYLEQLKLAAGKYHLDLADVCEAEGVSRTTLARWLQRETSPREATAIKLYTRIEKMGEADA